MYYNRNDNYWKTNMADNDKQRVALHAASLIKHDMVVGLGTGSTADYFIEALARRKQQEKLNVMTVASSTISAIKAQTAGLPVIGFEQLSTLDLYVDGADEVTPELTLLKGRGTDLVKEKLLANASNQFYVLVDDSKLVAQIGDRYPVAVEVPPFAWQLVEQSMQNLGGQATLRRGAGGNGLAMSSHGSLILDVHFDGAIDVPALTQSLDSTPGVVEHGIFYQLASKVLLVKDDLIVTLPEGEAN